ncbi:MAG: low molecular weight phosphotyrosine protein phosphatase [Odoribacter sp.]|nr:low molecular weight phosphotyrosine protein phosphatase [Odoribacter sp.]
MKQKILFVCHGNICRSPMAEFILKKMVKEAGREDDFEIASAATSTEEIGHDIYPAAKECLRRHGVPFSRRAARQITQSDMDYYDRIFLMDGNNVRRLRYLLPEAKVGDGKVQLLMSLTGSSSDVADPWYTGDFERTYRDIVKALSQLLREILSGKV